MDNLLKFEGLLKNEARKIVSLILFFKKGKPHDYRYYKTPNNTNIGQVQQKKNLLIAVHM